MKLIIKLLIIAILAVAGWYVYETVKKPEDVSRLLTKDTVDNMKQFAIDKASSIDTKAVKDFAVNQLESADSSKLRELLLENKDEAVEYIMAHKEEISKEDFESIKLYLAGILSEKQMEKLKDSFK